jgi:hypothetical protein
VLGLNVSIQCQNSNDRSAQIRYVYGGFRSENSVTFLMAVVLILLMVCDVFSLSKN